jgi:ubiquinone biosynthesis protein COQ9
LGVSDTAPFSPIVEAALRLAAARDWATVSLADIAVEAGLSLSELILQASSKTSVLALLTREIDGRLLASLDADPVEGEPHDRLFDIMLRRLELLTPYKPAIASIVKAPLEGALDAVSVFCTALESLNRILAAARFETTGARGDFLRLGLVKVQADILRIWLADDDPGLARTMAQLDRRLRDTESWSERLEAPFSLICRFLRAFRSSSTKPQQDGSNAAAD